MTSRKISSRRRLGRAPGIIAKIMAVYPQSDFSDPSWGTLKLPACWIEFSLGATNQVTTLAMHVRGGEHAPDIVARILDALDVCAIDPNSKTGIFADQDRLRQSFARWGGFHARVDKMINDDR